MKMKTHIEPLLKALITRYIFFVFVILSVIKVSAQNYSFSIYGYGVYCTNDAYIFIPGNLTSHDMTVPGVINLDGKIELWGDIDNQSTGPFFIDIEDDPIGDLVMVSPDGFNQSINGITPIEFENLHLDFFTKNLELNNCITYGTLSINSRFNLNSNNFILKRKNPVQPSPPGQLNYETGHIHSESLPPTYGTLQWNIKNGIGQYKIPFGSGASDGSGNDKDLELIYDVTIPGSADGFVKFATYPTPFDNRPFPVGVFSLAPHSDINVVDRFWIIDPDYSTRPDIKLTFNYIDVETRSPNFINKSEFKAIRYNPNSSSWNDWVPISQSNPDIYKVSTQAIPKQHFFTNWTLASEEAGGDIWIPNAFTPDRDESYLNESFGPVITFPYAKYEFYVLDRWGEQIFTSDNILNRWDGTLGGVVVNGGVYTWLIVLTKSTGKKYKYTGTVNVIL
jgi:hypothetical protein